MQSNALSFLQEIFAVDEGNYMGHVFAGLAGLELGRYTEAKQHYKTAIAAQPDEPLAWKGLANYYDKHPPSGREEVEDALHTYQTLLPHVQNDTGKKRCNLSTLAALYHTVGNTAQMVATYSALLSTYALEEEGGTQVWIQLTTRYLLLAEKTQVWIQLTTRYLLLAEKTLVEHAWEMVQWLHLCRNSCITVHGVYWSCRNDWVTLFLHAHIYNVHLHVWA
jgi:tetratricopeptide (TPR) repeat protein